jgi:hypothetical protein
MSTPSILLAHTQATGTYQKRMEKLCWTMRDWQRRPVTYLRSLYSLLQKCRLVVGFVGSIVNALHQSSTNVMAAWGRRRLGSWSVRVGGVVPVELGRVGGSGTGTSVIRWYDTWFVIRRFWPCVCTKMTCTNPCVFFILCGRQASGNMWKDRKKQGPFLNHRLPKW